MIESENNRKGKLLAKKELLTKLNFCLGLCLVINLFFWWHLCSWSVALDDGSSPLTFIRELDRAQSWTSRPQIPPGGHHMHGPLCRNCTTGQRLASVAGVQGSLPDCPWSLASTFIQQSADILAWSFMKQRKTSEGSWCSSSHGCSPGQASTSPGPGSEGIGTWRSLLV